MPYKLAVKAELRARRTGPHQNEILVGGHIAGVGPTISDDQGAVWTPLELLDGTRTRDEVAAQLAHSHGIAPHDVVQVIVQLMDDGILEAVSDEPERESARSTLRASLERSRSLHSWMDRSPRSDRWEVIDRLRAARVVLIGLGGTGTHAALGLASSGVGHLTLVDFDVVEKDNLDRQVLYCSQDVGRPKAAVAARSLRERFPDASFVPTDLHLRSELQFDRILEAGYDCLVLAADEPQTIRAWANRACLRTRTPWAAGGYQGPQTSTWLFRPGNGPCFECLARQQIDRRAELPPRTDLSHWRATATNAVTYVTAALSGAFLANAALSLLTGVPQIESNRQYFSSVVRPDHAFSVPADAEHARCERCS